MARIAGTAGQGLGLGDRAKRSEFPVQRRRRCQSRICPRLPRARQGDAKCAAARGVEAIGDRLFLYGFDKGRHPVAPVFFDEVVKKERPISIAPRAPRPLRRVAPCLGHGLESTFACCCSQDHVVKCALHPPSAGQRGFVPGGDAFMHPAREGVRGKRAHRQRHAPEHLAQTVAAHPVDVEDVRHFMGDDVF